jgi:hypothetical protein
MAKFVASVIAGLIATVLGGLILHQLTSQQGQQRAPHVTAPPDIDFSAPAQVRQPGAAGLPPLPPGFVLDKPETSPAASTVWTERQKEGFLTYGEAERGCGEGARIWKFEHDGRWFCF